jgi:hypothetical protein
MGGGLLFGPGALVYAAFSAVVADTSHVPLIDRSVVHIVNDGDVHVVDGAIVVEASPVPTSAFITVAEVAVSIIDSAIETYDRAPEAFIKDESTAAPSPVSRSPQETELGSQHPCAGNPIVIVEIGVPGPVAGSPDETVAGANGLFVNGQIWRRKPNRDAHGDLCGRWCGQA